MVTFHESRLLLTPSLTAETLEQFAHLAEYRLDKRELGTFQLDFSCASSALEGGTYSALDTQALLDYREKATGKPLEDAYLVLNHAEAVAYLYDHLDLTSIFKVQALLTSDHGLQELRKSQHFLAEEHQGVVRESSCQAMLERVLVTSAGINNPLQAAFYLLSRIAYLRPFDAGNQRTARAMCNVPLMQAYLPPISFFGLARHDYIHAIHEFQKLGDVRHLERCFVAAYAQSLVRLRIRG